MRFCGHDFGCCAHSENAIIRCAELAGRHEGVLILRLSATGWLSFFWCYWLEPELADVVSSTHRVRYNVGQNTYSRRPCRPQSNPECKCEREEAFYEVDSFCYTSSSRGAWNLWKTLWPEIPSLPHPTSQRSRALSLQLEHNHNPPPSLRAARKRMVKANLLNRRATRNRPSREIG